MDQWPSAARQRRLGLNCGAMHRSHSHPPLSGYARITVIAAITASLAVASALAFPLHVWSIFIGWMGQHSNK